MQANKDEGSLDTQEARLRAAIQSRSGNYEIRHVFREEGESGKSLDRPALQRLLETVRRGEVDLVIVTRIDRLSRSLLDFYEVHRLFETNNVQFVSLNETFDTSSAVGRAMLKLVLVFAELEREQTAERTRLAIAARAERGLWNGGSPPLGYDSAGNGHLTVNEGEAELVKLIFAKYLEMASTIKVAAWLNENGYRQKSYESRRRGQTGGKHFQKFAVGNAVTNRLYLGEIEHKGRVFPGQHPAIIDRATFDRAEALLASHRIHPNGPKHKAVYDYLLTGLLRCSCGHALTTSCGTGGGGVSYPYYRCVGLHRKIAHVCEVKQIRAELTDNVVMSVVREVAKTPRLLEQSVAHANRLAQEEVTPLKERHRALRLELADAERLAADLLRQILGTGVGSSATAKKLLADAETRAEQLRISLSELEEDLAARSAESLNLEVMLEALRGFDDVFEELTLDEKREFLQLMVKEVEVTPKDIRVRLYEGRQAVRVVSAAVTKRQRRGTPCRTEGNGSIRGGGNGASGQGSNGFGWGKSSIDTTGTVLGALQQAEAAGAKRAEFGKKNETPEVTPGFVQGQYWLPTSNTSQPQILL